MRGCQVNLPQRSIRALLLGVVVVSSPQAPAQTPPDCSQLNREIRAIYTFKPSALSDGERDAKVAAMERIWTAVRAQPKVLTDCLRRALEAPGADPWFRFDGSNLLVDVDPSEQSKQVQVHAYTEVDLHDVNQRVWLETLSRRAAEGYDVSRAASRWLVSPDVGYYLPEHGAAKVGPELGGFFLFGSMDEAHATTALIKLASDVKSPVREIALLFLINQATGESSAALARLDRTGLSQQVAAALDASIRNPQVYTPRETPRNTREEFLQAFRSIEQGDWRPFLRLAEAVPDGERDVVAVLRPEDIPLVRRVRRLAVARATPHAVGYYRSFTGILLTLMNRPASDAAAR
jgi:hypothetical protein